MRLLSHPEAKSLPATPTDPDTPPESPGTVSFRSILLLTLLAIGLYEAIRTAWSPTLPATGPQAMTGTLLGLGTLTVAFLAFFDASTWSPQLENRRNKPAPTRVPVRESKEPAKLAPTQDLASPRVFDYEAALARANGDRRMLQKMIGVFSLQWRQLSAEIARAGKRRDRETVELSAHKLHLSVASFGAGPASRIAQDLKSCAGQGNFNGMDAKCTQLKMEIDRLVEDLRAHASGVVELAS